MIMPRKTMVAAIAVVAVFSGAAALYMFALPGFCPSAAAGDRSRGCHVAAAP